MMINASEILNWLSMHETAYDDFISLQPESSMDDIPNIGERLLEFIGEHRQLREDFVIHFSKIDLDKLYNDFSAEDFEHIFNSFNAKEDYHEAYEVDPRIIENRLVVTSINMIGKGKYFKELTYVIKDGEETLHLDYLSSNAVATKCVTGDKLPDLIAEIASILSVL